MQGDTKKVCTFYTLLVSSEAWGEGGDTKKQEHNNFTPQ